MNVTTLADKVRHGAFAVLDGQNGSKQVRHHFWAHLIFIFTNMTTVWPGEQGAHGDQDYNEEKCARVHVCMHEHVQAPGDILNEQKKALSPWLLFSITTGNSVTVQESMFWILSLCVRICLRMQKMSKCGRNLPVIAAPSSQQLLTTGVSALSDVESGIQDFFGHPIITFFALVSRDERETMHESAILLYMCARCKIISQGEWSEIVNRCQGWTTPPVWYLNYLTLERFVQDLDLC